MRDKTKMRSRWKENLFEFLNWDDEHKDEKIDFIGRNVVTRFFLLNIIAENS